MWSGLEWRGPGGTRLTRCMRGWCVGLSSDCLWDDIGNEHPALSSQLSPLDSFPTVADIVALRGSRLPSLLGAAWSLTA